MRAGRWMAAVWLAVAAGPARAEDAPAAAAAAAADVTVDDAVALYRARSPRLAATRADLDVAGADLVDAGLRPNPSIELSGVHTLAGTDTIGEWEPSLALEVPVPIGHQRARRLDAARAHVAEA
ncbi:MAG TPA: hypothetical protein VHE35_18885, partial [Kofleriaceae bacterium]|nr:hypothetical protein [Kofleriaceae bacterium]